ncbi:hypothetical protein SSX86_023660 [Deinandra increscens subsp. villosa]|uniref:RING-type E3 ubiquitin transferase n=1 Tax=Deinandra increscens subsp. villosa TaxID=3103831 RepID=A0AAP0CRA8_9ASTR
MNTAVNDPLGSSNSQTFSNNSFFTPVIISVIGISTTALAVLFYHLLLVRYCIRRHAARMVALRTFSGEEIPTGVDEKTLSTIPITTFKRPDNPESVTDQSECAVCLGDLEDGDTVRVLPDCTHLFHVKCIDEWFVGHTSCPVCRVPVVQPEVVAQVTPPDDEVSCPVCRAVGTVGTVGTVPTALAPDTNPQPYREGRRYVRHQIGSDGGGITSGPRVMLRHCRSLVLPGEKNGRLTGMELKRSLSMGQSAFVIVDVNFDYGDKDCMCYSSFRDQSIRQFRRVSMKVKESISRMCLGQDQRSEILLPY